jgi:hypothetical protein
LHLGRGDDRLGERREGRRLGGRFGRFEIHGSPPSSAAPPNRARVQARTEALDRVVAPI